RMDGIEMLRALRADAATAKLPVLLLSARAGEDASVEGLQAGANDYLIKPFSQRELVARIQTLLAQAKQHATEQQGEHGPSGTCEGVRSSSPLCRTSCDRRSPRCSHGSIACGARS